MPWTSSGRLTNPIAGQIALDSGALPLGTRRIVVVMSCSVDVATELQHRDAANAATLNSQVLSCKAFDTVSIEIPMGLNNAANERYRIENISAIAGVLSVSVFT
jgi:hypothetical protein